MNFDNNPNPIYFWVEGGVVGGAGVVQQSHN